MRDGTVRSGWIQGGGYVTGSADHPNDLGTYYRSGGAIDAPEGHWLGSKSVGADRMFRDPFEGKGQPPLNENQENLNYWPVEESQSKATLTSSNPACQGGVCRPGNYYAVERLADGTFRATGKPIVVDTNVSFGGSTFGDYAFFGGLRVARGTTTFGPGRYVMAGVLDSSTDSVFWADNGVKLYGGTAENSDAGRIFVLTDSTYGGQLDDTVAGIRSRVANMGWNQLGFGSTELQAGANNNSEVRMYGLNRSAVPDSLTEFAPVLMWQDQQNSEMARGSSTPTTAEPSEKLSMWANQRTRFGGIVYQPQGAYVIVHAGAGYQGPLRIISGAMEVSGSAELNLESPQTPITYMTAALIE
jgi:hypothetical protein